MDENNYKTSKLEEIIGQCDNIDDFREEVLNNLHSMRAMWMRQIYAIIESNHYAKTAFAKLCGVSRVTVDKWTKGSLPQNREMFIRIGFAAHYNIPQMNIFLQKFGRYPALYALSLDDSVCMFVLNSKTLPHDYDTYISVLNHLKEQILPGEGMTETFETGKAFGNIMKLLTEAELQDYIQKNIGVYRSAFTKMYQYIEYFLKLNSMDMINPGINSIVIEWPSSMKKCVYDIRNKVWYPQRNKIISLGLLLNMNLEQLNELLAFAKMTPLYSKNPLEGAIMYALEDAELNDRIETDGSIDLYESVINLLLELGIMDEFGDA